MKDRKTPPRTPRPSSIALVWIDREHAVIMSGRADGKHAVDCLVRKRDEALDRFEARTVDEVVDDDQVVVSGPALARTSFERRYVAVTHRPDRLVDIEPTILGYQLAGSETQERA